jgi:hypothetical protein
MLPFTMNWQNGGSNKCFPGLNDLSADIPNMGA